MSKEKKSTASVNDLILGSANLSLMSVNINTNISPQLENAVQREDLQSINTLHRSGSSESKHILEAIVDSDKKELLEGFVTNAEDVDIVDGHIQARGERLSLFRTAVERKKTRCALAFIKMGVMAKTEDHLSLMNHAIIDNNNDVVEDLLNKIDNTDVLEECLRKAASYKNAEACEIILKHIPVTETSVDDPDSSATSKDTVISVILDRINSRFDPSFVEDKQKALSRRVSQFPGSRDQQGDSPLHIGARAGLNTEVLRVILQHRPHLLESVNQRGRTPVHEAAFSQQVENVKYLMSAGALLSTHDDDDVSVIETISTKTPTAMEEFRDQLNSGIKYDKENCTIQLDFSKIVGVKMEGGNIVTLFQDLADSSFKDIIEHPLIHCYISDMFKTVKIIFIVAILLPHLIYSTIFSVYAGIIFGDLCKPGKNESSEKDRWDWGSNITCKQPSTDNTTQASESDQDIMMKVDTVSQS